MAVPTMRPPARRAPRILTASAMKVEPRDQEARRRRTQSWQKNALEYARIVPELNYASRFYAKMLARIRIYPAFRDERERLTPIDDGLPVQLLDRIQDPGGGRSTLLGQYGRLMFITGEGYLFGRNLDQDDERWSFVCMDELELLENGGFRHKHQEGTMGIEYRPNQAVAYRLWSPSPEKSGEAESPMRAVEMIAEELVVLTKSVRSTAVTRMLNGMIKVPSELSFGAEEPGVDDDPEENPFLADLIDHITGAIENAGTAEAATPFLAEGSLEYLAALEWVRMHDPQNDYMEQGLRKEAIERLAHGLDFPAEYLLSLGNVNHWSARAITHEMWRMHGAPLAEQFCDDISEEYMRRALREAGFEDWRRVVVAYDDANVVVPVDRSDDADRASDRGMVSSSGYRAMKAIDEAMAPNEEEQRVHLAIKLRNPAFLKGTRFEVEEPEPLPATPGPDPSADEPRPVEDGPPDPGRAGVSREESRAAALHGVAYSALHRCREVAGARIRQALKTRGRSRERTAPELAVLDGHKNAQAAAVLGLEVFASCSFDAPLNLVKGGCEAFVSLCIEWGIDDTQARALGQTIEVFAARTLFEPGLPAFPSGFFAQIARANEVSNEIGEEGTVRRNNDALARVERMLPGSGLIVKAG
jgi:hypothetical protein